MATIDEVLAKNIEALETVINGDADDVTVAGALISKIEGSAEETYFLLAGSVLALGDEIEISGSLAFLKNEGFSTAIIWLTEE
jgi:hypothetical protein